MQQGLKHFGRGDYGPAERHFRETVEKALMNSSAWIGQAGCYDHVGRFDLADRAYRAAIKLSGETPQILNNQGHSYLLRGDLARARAKLRRAYRSDPDNPTIVNNLQIVEAGRGSTARH